jgi:hypothetical protein
MKKIQYKFLLFLNFCFCCTQAQLVVNGTGVVNINGGVLATPTYLVLNPVTNAITPITTIGTTGGIMMESEYNITKHNLGILTTGITVPYFSNNSGSWVQFPLGVSSISGASGAGNLQFSSKHATTFASGWQNALYMPSDVTNMNGWTASTYTADNSMDAIDRFWIIDALGYTTSPAVTYDFGYITAEGNANGGNIFSVPNLQAEAFDKVAAVWGNYGPTGVNTTGATEGDVSAVSVGAGLIGAKYRSWTLVDKTNPLPISLIDYSGTCVDNGINIKWSTITESNSDFFTLEKSYDAINFTWLTNITAAGNSNGTKNYTHFDYNENQTAYYRLIETDKNGDRKIVKIIMANGCNQKGNEEIHVFSGNDGVNLNVYSLSNQSVNITIYDVTGRLIYNDEVSAIQGDNNYIINPDVISGIYMVEIQTSIKTLTKRVPLMK